MDKETMAVPFVEGEVTMDEIMRNGKMFHDILEAVVKGGQEATTVIARHELAQRDWAIFMNSFAIALQRGARWERVERVLRAGGPSNLAIVAAVTNMPYPMIDAMIDALAAVPGEDSDDDDDSDGDDDGGEGLEEIFRQIFGE